MESVRQIVDGRLLSGVVSLPKSFQNIKVEIRVKPIYEKDVQPLTREKLRSMLKGSITESLSGALPYTDKTLDDFKAERLKRYENSD